MWVQNGFVGAPSLDALDAWPAPRARLYLEASTVLKEHMNGKPPPPAPVEPPDPMLMVLANATRTLDGEPS